jgi:large subunit ribosomal protein L19
MHLLVKKVEQAYLKPEIPDFRPGDTLRVAVRIVEGDKERVQNYEGLCIARQGGGMGETFTVRRVSFGVGMERTFPMHSPRVEGIKVLRQGRVRRAKLYYLRDLSGKKARISDTHRKRGAKDRMIRLLEAEGALDQTSAQPEAQPTSERPAQPPQSEA